MDAPRFYAARRKGGNLQMKWELHAHTAQSSHCGHVDAEDVVAAYAGAGYGGIVITDHFEPGNLDCFPGSPRDRVRAWLGGYERAKAAGDRLGVHVLFGLEARLPDCDNDYLIYGATPEFVLENPELHRLDLEGLHALCRRWGALLVQAHPNRKNCHPVDAGLLDGVEVFNGNPRHDSHNALTLAFAQAHPHLIRTSGSDYHQPQDLARGGIVADAESRESLIQCLREGRFERIETAD